MSEFSHPNNVMSAAKLRSIYHLPLNSKLFVRVLIPYAIYHILNTPTVYAQEGIYEGGQSDGVVGLDWILALLQNVLSVALQLIGIASFITLLVGGFKLVTASGDPKAMESGQKTITWAIGGLIVAALAWFIFKLIQDVTGVDVTTITLPTLN